MIFSSVHNVNVHLHSPTLTVIYVFGSPAIVSSFFTVDGTVWYPAKNKPQ